MCLLVKASAVKALIVDPEACKWLGRKFGCDIGEHLARHGADVDVELVASRGRPVPEVILGKAKEFGADLLVVGAKNPAQLQEVLFGSAARSLLAKMPVPVLMSR
jgi:nucleotide-binding universal stress UspA family protein